jgi:putative phosphoesterase
MPEVDELVCLGDVIGYNPYPGECLDLVREECDTVLQGNHDREIEAPERYGRNEQAFRGLELAREELDSDDVEYLLELPEKTELARGDVLAVHSQPRVTDQYVMPDDFPKVEKYLDGYDALVLGHTHVQHEERFDEGLVLNPGSVGQPRDGDPRASYAVVDTDSMDVDLYRTSYDIFSVVQEVNNAGLPKETGERLLPEDVESGKNRRRPW